jgi:type I restriction enzyme S subunit
MELAIQFKNTEVGAIPADWDLLPLPEGAWYQEGPGVRNYQFTRSGIKLFNGTNIQNGQIDLCSATHFCNG